VGDILQSDIVLASELGESELSLWRSWQQSNPGLESPFLCPELAITQLRHNPRLRVAVIRDGNEIVGFLPFEQKRKGIAHVRMFICAAEQQWDIKDVMRLIGASVLEYDYLVDSQLTQFQPHFAEREAAPVTDLSAGWTQWIAAKQKASSQIKNFVRKQRKLGREVGELDFELQSGSHEDLEQLIAWKSAQLVLTGRHDRFNEPAYRALFHDLLDSPTENFSIHLSRLSAGDRVVGLHLTATTQHIASVWHTAYDPDPELAKYSCGMALMLSHMETAAGKAITKIEYGKGEARYKEAFKDYDEYVAQGWTERATPIAIARRLEQAPKRIAYRVVLGNPRLRVAARHTLARIGEVRAKVKKLG
jgi:CelD/BcsL family acetyltransferase involved in cellulose biosynthesis